MGIRVIGQKKFEVTETELLQQDLLFYLDNPRVYSVLHENGHDNPTQTEIEEMSAVTGNDVYGWHYMRSFDYWSAARLCTFFICKT